MLHVAGERIVGIEPQSNLRHVPGHRNIISNDMCHGDELGGVCRQWGDSGAIFKDDLGLAFRGQISLDLSLRHTCSKRRMLRVR